MIYKKEANFPYPLLTNTSDSYENCQFILDIHLNENTEFYYFTVKSEIDSEFIKKLIQSRKARLILVIQSKDSKFYEVQLTEAVIAIPKTRLSLSKRTTLQLFVQAIEEVNFKENGELSPFYDGFKEEITVPKYSALGFSNGVIFNGSADKPFQLFEKRVDPQLKSEISIILGNETIIITYKSEEFQFNDSSLSESLNYPYVYMGLQKALYRFIISYGSDGEQVYLDEIGDDPANELDFKLYHLMKSKMVTELNTENMDEVISKISDKILHRFTSTVRGMYKNED